MSTPYPIRQIAYAVPDPVAAATRHSRLHGSGPFFLAEHVPVVDFVHRGTPGSFDHTTVFGQWGDVMVEFFVQHNDAPSHNHDMYPFGSKTPVLHHYALIVDDLDKVIGDFAEQGCSLSSRFRLTAGFEVVMIDARPVCGHMVEIYLGVPIVQDLYGMVAQAAAEFDASQDLIRRVDL